jgi:hypothetical protein
MSTWELLKSPGVSQVMLMYNYIAVMAFTFTAVYPVWLYTPVSLGGLGFSPVLIAAGMGAGGGAQSLWLLLVFPPLHKRVGTGGVLRLCAWVWPFFFIIDPMCNVLLRYGLTVPFWIVFWLNTVFGCGVAMAFSKSPDLLGSDWCANRCLAATQLAVNDIAPSHETFGTLNSIVLATQSGVRAVFPAVSTSIFAIGVKYHIFGGQLIWVLLVLLASGLRPILSYLPEKAQGKPQTDEDHAA